ncbi:MAG TPA: hypothetical protein VFG66_04410 [Gemmatimonadales bacterium]|nr:hypothetical protein [Gemmatimonadales bacterium]
MRSPHRRVRAIAGMLAVAVLALSITTPAWAQFGGLKKRLKAAAGQEGAAPAGNPGGGTIVLSEDVVSRLLAGLQAGQTEREAAAKEDTPYGRFKQAEAAYAEAQPKCQAAQQTFSQRMAGDQKVMDKYSALVEKMVAAQGKGDQKLVTAYQDSAMAMQDPSCVVKQPRQPDGYYDAQRELDVRAEQQELKTSGYSRSELAMIKERTEAILRGATPPGDASPAEKAAVSARATELKPLLGIHDQPAARAQKPTPAPAPAPAPAAAQAPPAASSMNACMMKNTQNHQAELEAIGKRAEAAQAAGDTQKLMALADSLQQIQMAGCR